MIFKMKLRNLLFILLISSLSKLLLAQNEKYTTNEEKVLVLINELRTNPKLFAEKYVANRAKDNFVAKDCYDYLIKAKAVSKVEISKGLNNSAEYHTKDIGYVGTTSNNSTDNTPFDARIASICKCEYELLSEVISYGSNNALDIVMQLVIDEDSPERNNRKALLNENFNKIGISIAKHRYYNFLCVVDLGKITVEYDDNVVNNTQNQNTNTFSLQEKELFDLINLVRTKPAEFAKKYLEINKNKSADYLECYNELIKMQAVGVVITSPALNKSAKMHVDDIGPKGMATHDASNGLAFSDKIKKYCNCSYSMIAENIDFGSSNPLDILIALLVDEGIPDRGHRKNILEKNFKYIGISIGKHASYNFMCVIDFADNVEPK